MTHEIHCSICNRKPEEISEYIDMAEVEGGTPSENVIRNEGTYSPMTGHFYCTTCYIKLGMPNGLA